MDPGRTVQAEQGSAGLARPVEADDIHHRHRREKIAGKGIRLSFQRVVGRYAGFHPVRIIPVMIHEKVAQFMAQDVAELIRRAVLIPVDDAEGGIGQGDSAGHLQGRREVIRDPVGIVPDRGQRNQGDPHISGQAERVHRKPADP